MKPKLIRILFSFSILVFAVFCAQQISAQDSMSPSDGYETNDEKERGEPVNTTGEQVDHTKSASTTSSTPLIKESEASSSKSVAQQRAVTTKPATDNAKPESKQSADDSILSFNFLYYIIQKYKLQDIVD